MAPTTFRPLWNHETAFGLFVWALSTFRVAFAVLDGEASTFEVNVAYAVALGSSWLLLRGAWRFVRARGGEPPLPGSTHPYRDIKKT
jgi:hypothetical protein